jgi:hypothetical protein
MSRSGWRRRVAYQPLSPASVGADRLDEAGQITLEVVTGGRLVPSSHWRAREVIAALDARRHPEAAGLRDAFQEPRAPEPA